MLDARALWDAARRPGRSAFVRDPRWFLLKHANGGEALIDPKLDYHTVAIPTSEALTDADPFPNEWRYLEIAKRAGNPFPDRISLGRANNCDIVLRFGFVSKLHAHFIAGDGAALRLVDNRSANGTVIAGRPLAPGETASVHSGDWIAIGPLRLQLLDASDVFDALARAFEP